MIAGVHRESWCFFWIILPWFLLVYAPFEWGGNEEHYFQLAFQSLMPTRFPAYDGIFDAARTKIVSEWLIGGAVWLFGYDGALIFWRLILAGLTTASVTSVCRALEITPPAALAGLSLALLIGPDILGGEGLFGTVEGKSFAYPLILWSWAMLLRGRYLAACLLMAAATWLHLTAAIYWLGASFVYLLVRYRGRNVGYYSLLYILLIMPLMWIVYQDQSGAETVNHGPITADFIYSILRNPHHTAPFSSEAQFTLWLPGIIKLAVFFLWLVGFVVHYGQRVGGLASGKHWPFYAALLAVATGLILAIPVSALDATIGFWGKFTLFRASALLLLFGCLLMCQAAWDYCQGNERAVRGGLLLCGLLVVASLGAAWQTKYLWQRREQIYGPDWQAMAQWLDRSGPADGIVLTPPEMDWDPAVLTFSRWLERPTLINFKFSPSVPTDLFEWLDRLNFRSDLYLYGCNKPLRYPVHHIILRATQPVLQGCGPVVFTHGSYNVIAIDPIFWPK